MPRAENEGPIMNSFEATWYFEFGLESAHPRWRRASKQNEQRGFRCQDVGLFPVSEVCIILTESTDTGVAIPASTCTL